MMMKESFSLFLLCLFVLVTTPAAAAASFLVATPRTTRSTTGGSIIDTTVSSLLSVRNKKHAPLSVSSCQLRRRRPSPLPSARRTTTERLIPLQGASTSSSSFPPTEDEYLNLPNISSTPVSRMRKRKVRILAKKRLIKVIWLFTAWYVFSVLYNIWSKQVLMKAPQLSWTAAWIQMTCGLLYVLPMWKFGDRKPPTLSLSDIRRLLPISILHSLVHIGGVVSMGAGAVSFTYIVKASEPAVSAILSVGMGQGFLPWQVYPTLIPIMAGVSLSSISELTFTWKSFSYAMMSNVASSLRGLVGKRTFAKRLGKNLTPANLYAILTLLSTILLLPVTIALEGHLWIPTFRSLVEQQLATTYIIQSLLAGFCYYAYNEVSFLCLKEVSPVSHAIGNTLKRVAIILSSILVFRNKLTLQGIIGSAMAIGGVLLYSLVKVRYDPKRKQKQQKQQSEDGTKTP